MKRLLSLLLGGALLAALALPAAAAEESADARLTKVTQAVKDTLSLDTERYKDFQGECYDEELVPVWSLRWTGEDGSSLSVEALEDGTVASYYLRSESYRDTSGWGLPAFPADSGEDAARMAAEAFLAKVLLPGEGADLDCPNNEDSLYRSGYTFYGGLTLNGLPSPLTCSLTVEEGQVVRFRRDTAANTFLGDIPSSEAQAEQTAAAASLREGLALKLEYVRSEQEEGRAVLRYRTETDLHTLYVDADTGEVLDITALSEGLSRYYKNEMAADVAAPSAMSGGGDSGATLSAAEQAGVEKLKDVRSAAELDAALRAAYGLQGYALSSSAYTLEKGTDGKEDAVLCALHYTRTAEDEMYYRHFTVDARSGEVRSLYSYAPWGREPELTASQAQAKAESFLKELCPDRSLALYESDDQTEDGAPYYRFTFARKENGYFFAANAYTVGIDSVDGSVYSLRIDWDEDLDFDLPEDLVSASAALDAWADTYETTLAYRLVPQKLDASDPLQARLVQRGRDWCYVLRLTYALEREDTCLGVDARTGSPVWAEKKTAELPAYTDLSGSTARADIETLARYGVGYASSQFLPGNRLTQWDFVCLLSSIQGGRLDPAGATKDQRDDAYSIAYSLGALTRAERNDSAALTRGEVVKMLLNAAGYGPAARLTGIYTCSYSDAGSIPAGDLGYAAIAQALGLAKGSYAGTRTANRGEAASMLCRLLERTA